jgi:deoxyribodipyrimidine photolyase-related protein
MSVVRLVLGDQLFYPVNSYIGAEPVIMLEHADLCKNFRFHKIKIAFFFSAMRHYRDALTEYGVSVTYIRYSPKEKRSFFDVLFDAIQGITGMKMIEIADESFRIAMVANARRHGVRLEFEPSPMFLNRPHEFSDYLGRYKSPFMKTFYQESRKKWNVLLDEQQQPLGGKWSFDEDNRKKCPKGLIIPQRLPVAHDAITDEVIIQVNSEFSEHPGDARHLWLPVTRDGALNWWKQFKTHYFFNFGDYEDAIEPRDPFLFHSAISALLNCGLLTPMEIITDAVACLPRVSLNAVEGFVRQILGWREFIKGIYDTYNDVQHTRNFWGATHRLGPRWWTGNTGHLPLDDALKSTFRYAYSHHILRLMLIGSTMMCCDIHPKESYRWFMEYYVDGAEWVMGPNVFGMSQFSDGGIFATKPYLCGSNYIRKMSHYGGGPWCDIADGLYWRFILNHAAFFEKNYRMRMAVSTLNKMSGEKRARLMAAADAFIQKVTMPCQ